MTGSNDRKRAAVMRLVRKGLLTPDEAADLTSTPRGLVEYWALREGIDIATTRAIYLLKIWRSELMVEQQGSGPRKKVKAEAAPAPTVMSQNAAKSK
jgi:hypothetical protein